MERFALVFAAVMLFGARGFAETGVSPDEIVIGSCIPLSGAAKDLGESELSGARAYLQYINAEKHGVHGRKLRLIAHDDKYEPDEAIACFKKLSDEGVFTAAFFSGAPTGIKYVSMAETAKLPIIGYSAGLGVFYEPFKRYLVSVRATYEDEAANETEHLWTDAGIRKIAVIYQNDALGAWLEQGAIKTLRAHSAAPVALAEVTRNSMDVGSAVETIRAAKPQAVLVYMNYSSAAAVVKKATAEGWRPLFVQSPGRDAFISLAGRKAAEGVIWAVFFPDPNDTNRRAVSLFRSKMKRYAPKQEPSAKALEGFVHAMILVEGLQRAGKEPTREKLLNAIESMDGVDLGLGPEYVLRFGPKNHQGFKHLSYIIVKKGRPVPLTDWRAVVRGLAHP